MQTTHRTKNNINRSNISWFWHSFVLNQHKPGTSRSRPSYKDSDPPGPRCKSQTQPSFSLYRYSRAPMRVTHSQTKWQTIVRATEFEKTYLSFVMTGEWGPRPTRLDPPHLPLGFEFRSRCTIRSWSQKYYRSSVTPCLAEISPIVRLLKNMDVPVE
jgi:hypothetical protein